MNYIAQTVDVFPLATVLVVDPDPDSGELYGLMLSGIAHEIQRVDDGRIALARALASPPSLVVTETRVPYIDGLSLCQLLRRDPATADVPIVIGTSNNASTHIAHAYAVGADAVLLKPFDIEPFVTAIRDAVAHRYGTAHRAAPRISAVPDISDRVTRTKTRAHGRYATSSPPNPPPRLRCPSCDRSLEYRFSHIGGVNAEYAEQWDHFECAGCGSFDYRHRTKKLAPTLTSRR